MNSATKVGEIFTAAGQAFSRLGDLTMQLHANSDTPTGSQIRQALKKKAFEDAGIPAKQLPAKQAMSKATKQPSSNTQKLKQIQTVHIQQILPVQTISTTTPHQPHSHHSQPLQTAPKQIIIHQTNPSTLTAKKQQTTPQIVHIQTQQLHQLQQLQTTTVTLQQFQQMQQQQKNIAAATTLVSLPSTILAKTAEQLKEHKQLSSTAKQSVVVASATVSGTVATSNNVATIVDTSGSSAGVGVTAIPSTGLKCGPDVMMTLNRLNTQEHDEAEDVTECRLPSDVAKLDFAGEEVVG